MADTDGSLKSYIQLNSLYTSYSQLRANIATALGSVDRKVLINNVLRPDTCSDYKPNLRERRSWEDLQQAEEKRALVGRKLSRRGGGSEAFIGETMITAADFCPKYWVEANGQILPINSNQALFSLLGTR